MLRIPMNTMRSDCILSWDRRKLINKEKIAQNPPFTFKAYIYNRYDQR